MRIVTALFGSASRYLQSGLLVYAIDLGTFWILNAFVPAQYAVWTVVGRISGATAGFFLHDGYSFAGHKAVAKRVRMFRYLTLLMFNAVMSVLLLELAVTQFHMTSAFARPVIDILVIALAYLASKHWVFSRTKQ